MKDDINDIIQRQTELFFNVNKHGESVKHKQSYTKRTMHRCLMGI